MSFRPLRRRSRREGGVKDDSNGRRKTGLGFAPGPRAARWPARVDGRTRPCSQPREQAGEKGEGGGLSHENFSLPCSTPVSAAVHISTCCRFQVGGPPLWTWGAQPSCPPACVAARGPLAFCDGRRGHVDVGGHPDRGRARGGLRHRARVAAMEGQEEGARVGRSAQVAHAREPVRADDGRSAERPSTPEATRQVLQHVLRDARQAEPARATIGRPAGLHVPIYTIGPGW